MCDEEDLLDEIFLRCLRMVAPGGWGHIRAIRLCLLRTAQLRLGVVGVGEFG